MLTRFRGRALNAGRRGTEARRAVTIDFDWPEGIEAFMRLVEQALTEAGRPGGW